MKINRNLTIDFALREDGKPLRCTAKVKDSPPGWRLRRGYGNNCQRHAVYLINNEGYFCRLHAGDRVLDLLMKDHPSLHYVKSNVPRLQRKP